MSRLASIHPPLANSKSSVSRSFASPRLVSSSRSHLRLSRFQVKAAVEAESQSAKQELLKPELYVACNRFNTRSGKGPKFEKRWAERKSRLAELDGFEFFTLLRRVDTKEDEKVDFNYMSLTMWSDKSSFNAWRTGEAFKEAHGGGSLFGFVTMMVSSTMTLEGPPKPAFWNGLLPLAAPMAESDKPKVVDGWRQVHADGENLLPAECYVTCNRFLVAPGREAEFEERWASRDSKLTEVPGFKQFVLCRRDAGGKKGHGGDSGDGYNYMSLTVWENKEAFDGWRTSENFAKAHGAGAGGERKKPDTSMFLGPPSLACYEGTLVIRA
uniref:Antibiotic biosynthesis monooxygenase n=2 Tax=Tetraselmis sp. GSL018 TaxID=582737 RepID=A0A061R995_9CHLO|mmetsp:Transcript_41809/g.99180  ORF Transcript_41809/g.99180 Transcript_41809/m.99180 type:complete len:326 (+) Transcript_41809:124-1101(+)